MNKALPLTALLLAVAFAGCTDEPEPPAPVECDKPGHTVELVEVFNGTSGTTQFEEQCLAVATSSLTGLPDTAPAYFPIELTWHLHTDLDKSHSHKNGIRISDESVPDYLGKVDNYGEDVFGAKEEHRDFVAGDSTTVTWKPDGTGTFYLRSYAVSSAGNHWGPEQMIVIETPPATGEGKTVTISGGGLPGATSLSENPVTIELGDSVTWTTDDPAGTWSIDLEGLAVTQDEAFVFTRPGTYDFTASNELAQTGFIGTIDGQVVVNAP